MRQGWPQAMGHLSGFCTRASFPRITPATWVNDEPLETVGNRSVPMACGPNADQVGAPWVPDLVWSRAFGAPVLPLVPSGRGWLLALRSCATSGVRAGRAERSTSPCRGSWAGRGLSWDKYLYYGHDWRTLLIRDGAEGGT
jgi:hypothetical protein